jgi:hypothetical protein
MKQGGSNLSSGAASGAKRVAAIIKPVSGLLVAGLFYLAACASTGP